MTSILKTPSITLLGFALAMGTSACGSSSRERARGASTQGLTMSVDHLAEALVWESGDPVQVRVAGKWMALSKPIAGVSELRSRGRGGVVRVGETTLWLRGESHVRVGSDAAGKLVVDLIRGEARVRSRKDDSLRVGQEQGPGRDFLLSHRGQRTRSVSTESQPQHALWSMELSRPVEARGIGRLDTKEGEVAVPLELRKLNISVHLDGGMALTEVEHVFYNDSDKVLEGSFRFPAPDGVSVTGLAMEINNRLVEGEFVERMKARQVYEQIVDQMQDPALLEWQQGGWFKLRVFPIEAHSEKRVVLRYQAPLQESLEGYEYRYLATPPEGSQVGLFELRIDDKLVTHKEGLRSAEDVVVPVPASALPRVAAEERKDYSYRALTVDADWWREEYSRMAVANAPVHRRVVLALDSSRSALENRELSLELLGLVLGELEPGDSFALFAHDIAVREAFMGFQPASKANVERALGFYRDLELDGASDLGATMQYAAKLSEGRDDVSVIYIGDGTPSWGLTQSAALHEASEALGKSPLFAAILGRGASTRLWSALTGERGGTIVRPHTGLQAEQMAFFLARAAQLPRLEEAALVPVDGVDIFPDAPRTLFEGESMTVLVRAPQGKMPGSLVLAGRIGKTRLRQSVALDQGVVAAQSVAQRFASMAIARMEDDKAPLEEIVAMSREFGVQSKHTSLLVLESEEAYRQHQIARKEAEEQRLSANAPQVSGGDLDNLGGQEASLSPNNIQPGDPEVRIPAPADARSVVLVFPFGETKIAHFDEEDQTWIARFLISPDTADGQYWVRVHIEHSDGRLEEMRLPYTVDTSAPNVSVKLVKKPGGRVQIQVQELGELRDAIRVEVHMPWGQSERLYAKGDGFFRRLLRTPRGIGSTIAVRVVVTDEALNQRVLELELPIEAQ